MAKKGTTPRELVQIITRHQVFLEGLKTSNAQELARSFDLVQEATIAVINGIKADGIGALTRRELNVVLQQLQSKNYELIGAGLANLYKHFENIASYESGFEQRALARIARTEFLQPKAGVAYKNALAQPLSSSGQLLEKFTEDWRAGEVERVNNMVQRAWGEGWTNDRLTRAIRGTKVLQYKDGVVAISKRNAETVARTSVQHVASMGRMATWEANADLVDGYTYIATLDSKTTQVCRSLDKKNFELGKGPVPPVHPNCRSTTIARLDPDLDFLDEGATRSAEFGPVDANLSYYDWLKQQSKDFQIEALGPARASLFRDGGLSSDEFSRLSLDKNFRPLTLEQMQALEPLAFKRAGLN